MTVSFGDATQRKKPASQVTSHFSNTVQRRCFCTRTDGLFSKVNITDGSSENFRLHDIVAPVAAVAFQGTAMDRQYNIVALCKASIAFEF